MPDFKSEKGFNSLRKEYGFGDFDRPQQYKMQADILSVAVKTASALTAESGIIKDTAYLVLDSLIAAPAGFEFFPRFPKEEAAQFTRLAVASRENQTPLPIVCPVCPDYDDHYQLSDGIDGTADKALNNLVAMVEFFGRRNLSFRVAMHVADVEAFEPLILQASGETTESFLKKTSGSITAIQERIYRLGLEKVIYCGSMLEVFGQSGADYFALKEANARQIIDHQGKKVRKTIEALMFERKRLGHFNLLEPDNHKAMAAEELADYAAYGDLVNGRAVILSPDTLSPMPAYNFLRGGQKLFNPTIYLKNVRERQSLYGYD